MRIQLALLCVVATSLAGFSQDKNFDLSRYKFPDYKRHEMELNFRSDGYTTSNYYDSQPAAEGRDESSSSFGSVFNVGYSYERNTRKHIDFLNSSVMGQYQYSKSANRINDMKITNPRVTLDFHGSSKYYLKEDKLFVEGIGNMWLDFNNRKYSYASEGHQPGAERSIRNSIELSAGAGIGLGRIEKVNDFWQAYYILEKLNGQKSLSRELQEKDIFEFATLASQLKNERFFDARLRKIAELKALDSLLQLQGLIENEDIAYFTTLNDYWSYGNFPERRSGGELKFTVLPTLEHKYQKPNDTTTISWTRTSLVSSIGYEHTKQLNLFWERNFSIRAYNTTLMASEGDTPEDYPANLKSAVVMAGVGFFPDSRTSMKGFVYYSGNESVINNADQTIDKTWQNYFNLRFEMNYYISPQLQLTANLRGTYEFSEYQSMEHKNISYEVGLRYAVF